MTGSIAAATVLTAPDTLTLMTRSSLGGVVVRKVAARPRMPALAMATSSRPNRLDGLRHRGAHRLEVGHVAVGGERLRVGESGRGTVGRGLVDVDEGDVGPPLDEDLREAAAEATAGAGDEDDLLGEREPDGVTHRGTR